MKQTITRSKPMPRLFNLLIFGGLTSMLFAAPEGWAQSAPQFQTSNQRVESRTDYRLARAPDGQQRRGKRGKKGKKHKLSPEERAALKKEVQRKIQTFVTVELATRLELDEKKSLKLSQAVKEHLAQREASREKIRAEREKLEALLSSGASDSEIGKQTDVVIEMNKNIRDEQPFFRATSSFLSKTEQAKLVLAYHHIQKEVKRMVRHAKRNKKGRGPHGPGGNRRGGPGY